MIDENVLEKMNLLQKVELFSTLNQQELEIVAYHSEITQFKQGNLIFTENSPSNELYVIKKGEVLISKLLDENNVDIAQYISGEAFGEWDLIADTPRSATAIAMKDTDLLIFPREGITLPMVLNKYPKMSAHMLYKVLGIIAGRIKKTQHLINEKTPWMQNLKKQMVVDKLTGLYNRNYLLDEFDAIIDRNASGIGLLMIKPDMFKEINDRFGHDVGDKILILMSIFIQSALGAHDIAIRYHGNEFAVVLPGSNREQAIAAARELGSSLSHMDISHITNDENEKITMSIGISYYPSENTDPKMLINTAHKRMQKAWSMGGNRIIIQH